MNVILRLFVDCLGNLRYIVEKIELSYFNFNLYPNIPIIFSGAVYYNNQLISNMYRLNGTFPLIKIPGPLYGIHTHYRDDIDLGEGWFISLRDTPVIYVCHTDGTFLDINRFIQI